MAKCKYCNADITRLDKDVCPFCGASKPLEGTDTSTQDITKVIGQVEKPVEIKHKKRVIALILSIIFGIFGAPFYYIGKLKNGFIALAISVVLIGGLGTGLFFAMNNVFGFLIPYFVLEIVHIILGIRFITSHNLVDKNGEFLE